LAIISVIGWLLMVVMLGQCFPAKNFWNGIGDWHLNFEAGKNGGELMLEISR
jgi:hypothetical protein